MSRHSVLALFECPRHPRLVPGVMGGFAEDMTQIIVAGLGYPPAVGRSAAGVLTGDQPGVGHELAGSLEPTQVAGLRDDGHRGNQGDPAHGLQRRDEREVGAALSVVGQFALQSAHSLNGGLNLAAVVVEDDLSGGFGEGEAVDPGLVLERPGLDPGWRYQPPPK